MLVAAAGSATGLISSELSGIGTAFTRGVLVTVVVFCLLAAWSIRAEKLPLALAEEVIYLVLVTALLCVLAYALYAPIEPEQSRSALRGFFLWLPCAYVLVFIIHEGRGALVRAFAVYLLAVAISLPAGLSSLGSREPFSGFDSRSLDQLYISGLVIIAFLFFVSRVRERLRHSEVAAERMKRLAETDELTGLRNRRRIEALLHTEIERCQRYGSSLSVVIFDIDDFKVFNDAHGHDFGDFVLREVAQVVGRHLRTSDELGRWGGEEFLILAAETPAERAYEVTEKLRRVLAEHDFGTAGRVCASFGIATLDPTDSGTTLVGRADAALYRAKTQGKNRVEPAATEG